MKLYKIKSNFDALLYLNEQFIEISPSKTLCVENENALIFNVYPIDGKLSYSVNTQTECPNYRVVDLKDFSFVLLEKPLSAENFYVRTIGGVKIKITPHKIFFETSEHGSCIPVKNGYSSFKTVEVEKFAGVHLLGEVEMLFLYSPENNLVSSFEGESIKIEGNNLTVFSSEKGIAKHATKTTA